MNGLSELRECQRRQSLLHPMRRGISVASCSNRACLRRRQTACCGFDALNLRRFDREDVGSEVLPRVQTRRCRNVCGDALSLRPGRKGRAGRPCGLEHGRKRHGQGVDCEGHTPAQCEARRAFRRHQLRRNPGGAARIGIVRSSFCARRLKNMAGIRRVPHSTSISHAAP